MSETVTWKNPIIPNDFRNLSMDMAKAYMNIDSVDKELGHRYSEKKEPPTVEELNSHLKAGKFKYDLSCKATRRAWFWRIIMMVAMYIILDAYHDTFNGKVSETIYGVLAFTFLVVAIAIPLILIRPKFILRRLEKTRKNVKLLAEKQEFDLYDAKYRKEKLDKLFERRAEAYSEAKKYEPLYEIWECQAMSAQTDGLPWANEKSYIELVHEIVRFVSIDTIHEREWSDLVFEAYEKYKIDVRGRYAMVKDAQALVRDIFK